MMWQTQTTIEYPFALRPASIEEAGLFYSQMDEAEDAVLGTVGHIRMDFGASGKEFYHTWWPHNGDQFNTGEFKDELQKFVDMLRADGPLTNLASMRNYCYQHGGKKNYGAEGAEVIVDNCQVNLYGGFAPASQTAVELSKALGSRTVMSGSISRGKNDPSQSLQMIERPLMTPDELKSMPKGSFIVAKTGVHPMKVKLRLFLDWGIRFGEPYEVPEKAQRAVAYADKQELEESIIRRHYGTVAEEEPPQDVPAAVGGMNHGMQAEKNSRKTILRP